MAAKKQPAKGTTPGTRYREVAECRLKDSAALMAKKRYDAAVYLCGYAIECRLKFTITATQGVRRLPPEHEHHSWELLLDLSGLRDRLRKRQAVNSAFWATADDWHPRIRYEVNRFDKAKAEKFCKLVEAIHTWLKETVP